VQDRAGGGDDAVSQLISKEDREELLNRKIEEMKKRNEELLQKHLVCTSTLIFLYVTDVWIFLNIELNRECVTEAAFIFILYCIVCLVFLQNSLIFSYHKILCIICTILTVIIVLLLAVVV